MPTGTSPAAALDLLTDRPLVVLTGAGLSTDSGIPDYRGPGAPARMPMTYQEFVSGYAAQQRYWARSHIGWGRMKAAEPNDGHRALAAIDPTLLITQNVDGLHEAAARWLRSSRSERLETTGGSRDGRCATSSTTEHPRATSSTTEHPRATSSTTDDQRATSSTTGDEVVALHGRIADVICLACRTVSPRAALQARMEALNPGWAAAHADVEVRPDGDVALEETDGFVVPACEVCGGVLKPDVVFFGENVPKERVQRCYDAVDALVEADGALLVAGSSLTVMSGLRFVRRAAKAGTPIVIVNRGATRGDDLATYKVEGGTSEFLTALRASRAEELVG